jgi:hypothetical protein
MTTPSINEILNYANLQMAAEAFLVEGEDNGVRSCLLPID